MRSINWISVAVTFVAMIPISLFCQAHEWSWLATVALCGPIGFVIGIAGEHLWRVKP